MNKIKKIFNKIKTYFMQLFNKKDTRSIEESSRVLSDFQQEKNYSTEEQTGKNDFSIVYKNLKNGIIQPEQLMINDLIKVQLMMKNELNHINDEITISEDEIHEINNDIINFKQSNNMYKDLKTKKYEIKEESL